MPRLPQLPPTREILDWTLTVHERDNPKRAGSMARQRYDGYLSPNMTTVADALANGIRRDDLVWDRNHSFISIVRPR
jgi:hypothetical protein